MEKQLLYLLDYNLRFEEEEMRIELERFIIRQPSPEAPPVAHAPVPATVRAGTSTRATPAHITAPPISESRSNESRRLSAPLFEHIQRTLRVAPAPPCMVTPPITPSSLVVCVPLPAVAAIPKFSPTKVLRRTSADDTLPERTQPIPRRRLASYRSMLFEHGNGGRTPFSRTSIPELAPAITRDPSMDSDTLATPPITFASGNYVPALMERRGSGSSDSTIESVYEDENGMNAAYEANRRPDFNLRSSFALLDQQEAERRRVTQRSQEIMENSRTALTLSQSKRDQESKLRKEMQIKLTTNRSHQVKPSPMASLRSSMNLGSFKNFLGGKSHNDEDVPAHSRRFLTVNPATGQEIVIIT